MHSPRTTNSTRQLISPSQQRSGSRSLPSAGHVPQNDGEINNLIIGSPPPTQSEDTIGKISLKRALIVLGCLSSAVFIILQTFVYGAFSPALKRAPSMVSLVPLHSDNLAVLSARELLDDSPIRSIDYRDSNDVAKELVDLVLADDDPESDGDDVNQHGGLRKSNLYPHRAEAPVNRPVIAPPFGSSPPKYNKDDSFHLTWDYESEEKKMPYIGNDEFVKQFKNGTRHYYNSLAVFPHYNNDIQPMRRYHGYLGVYPDGSAGWIPRPSPPPIDKLEGGKEAGLKNGGFYLNLSDSLPLDRTPLDARDEVCFKQNFDYNELDDASVVITFYNEPLSTLLRTVHSVLNLTPPPLLREIILVDDHSNLTDNLPGGPLYEYVKLLPKTKILRLPERRGLVWARLAGAQASQGRALVVLDSHVEVNEQWLEPQLKRLHESPKSIVFPQVLAIDPETFSYNRHAGIGCWLSWKWSMVEQASLTATLNDTLPIPSASMAGGLFAVNLDWFWELGGYDEQFSMWGAENVEMGFRTWMCGGRLECTPCSYTYHIYREGGVGYFSPGEALAKNRLRTARAWLDEWFQISQKFIGSEENFDYGDLDHVLELKQRLGCRSFSWFLKNVDPKHEVQELNGLQILGEISNKKFGSYCIDTLNHYKADEPFGTFWCHHSGGTQGFYKAKSSKKIRTFNDETKCLSINEEKNLPVLQSCWEEDMTDQWTLDDGRIVWRKGEAKEKCLDIVNKELGVRPCELGEESQTWKFQEFVPDPNFKLPDFSPEYKKSHGMI